jgi:hypothetical protein
MTAADLISKLECVTRSANGWQARCPAHDDKNPSLSIADGEKGIVVHCHAGCTIDQITAAVGLKPADLFTSNSKPEPQKRIVATYTYQDQNGKALFDVVRYEPKDFRQRAANGDWSVKDIKKVPFHLPELIKAVADQRLVYICEGEKDVLAVEKAGFVATCNPGGAGKWQSGYGEHFRGAEVVIIADKDEAGRKHAADVAAKLKDVAAGLKVIELPGDKVKDAADFFAAGGTAAGLDEIAELATVWNGETKDDPWLSLIEDGADLQVKELPPIVEIVEGIVAEQSKLSIVSSAKSFKTWLTIYLALAVSHEVEFLGRATVRRRLLYVNLELKPQTFTRRLQAISQRLGIKIDRQWFCHLPLRGKMAGVLVHDLVSRIIAIAKRLQIGVVIIDPVFKANTEGDENAVKDQTIFFNELDRITTEAGCTLILNDHSGKGNQSEKDPLDVIRGSSAKGGDLDAAMVLRKHEVSECFSVDLVHRELPPVEPFVIGWDYPVMELRPDLDPGAMKKSGGGRKPAHDPKELLAAIADTTAGNPVSISAWAEAAGLKRQTLQNYLPGFRAKGWISTAGHGNSARQYITAKGLQACDLEEATV